jgi:uncharacterized protein
MVTLREKIQGDLTVALKSREALKVSVLRMLTGSLRNREIALRDGADIRLSDEQVAEVVAGEIKKRKDSIEAYQAGGREESAQKEKNELDILAAYLPQQLSDDEIEKIASEIVDAFGETTVNFGMVMGQLMPKIKGRADGNRASAILRKVLEKK